MIEEEHLSERLIVFLISYTFIETFVHLCRYNHLKNLLYQKYISYIAVGLWIDEFVKVKPEGSCHYEAANSQNGV